MKIRLLFLIFLLICLSCKNDDRLTFQPAIYNEKLCEDCPIVEITVPKALDNNKIDTAINTAVIAEVVSMLTFNDNTEAQNIEGAIRSFNEGFNELRQKYTDESTNWEAIINGEITYEDKKILTIQLSGYLFTGGAHGYSSTRFLNFDKKKGVLLESRDLFSKTEDFKKFAELKFRKQEKIPLTEPINSTGFMFDRNEFHLPDNIGYTNEGLQLFYEQYEVASYADGPIILKIPFKEVKKYLAIKVKS